MRKQSAPKHDFTVELEAAERQAHTMQMFTDDGIEIRLPTTADLIAGSRRVQFCIAYIADPAEVGDDLFQHAATQLRDIMERMDEAMREPSEQLGSRRALATQKGGAL